MSSIGKVWSCWRLIETERGEIIEMGKLTFAAPFDFISGKVGSILLFLRR